MQLVGEGPRRDRFAVVLCRDDQLQGLEVGEVHLHPGTDSGAHLLVGATERPQRFEHRDHALVVGVPVRRSGRAGGNHPAMVPWLITSQAS